MENYRPDKEEFAKVFKKRIYNYTLRLIRFIDNLPKDRVCFIIGDQGLRSGTSTGANYFESQAGSSKKDFINFIAHALKSSNETKFWLAVIKDSGKIKDANNQRELEFLHKETI